MLHPLMRAPSKRTRTNDVVRQAVNAGKPLPLTVMLENMWAYREEALRLEALQPGDDEFDPHAIQACRMAAQKCAVDAAPYVHPKLATVAVRPEDEEEAAERKAVVRATADQLRGLGIKELGQRYLQLARGEEVDGLDAAPVTIENQPPEDAAASTEEAAEGD